MSTIHTEPKPDPRLAQLTDRSAELSADQDAFIKWHDELDAPRLAPHTPTGDPHTDRLIEGMKSNGVARWPGFLAGDALARARDAAHAIVNDAVRAGESKPGGSVVDMPGGLQTWVCSNAEGGRTRSVAPASAKASLPPVLANLFDDTRLIDAVINYYGGAKAWVNYLLIERLTPSEHDPAWHFDKIFDQVKVMIPLSDVGPNNGPMHLLPGTQRRPAKIDLFVHQSFKHGPREGLDFAYPPEPLVRRLPFETIVCTASAGEALLFDTLAIHTGTRCRAGERLALVLAFNIATPKNDALYELMFPERAV